MNRASTDRRAATLRSEIAHTRAELGETVQELAGRADVPARAKATARRTADRLRAAGDQPRVWAPMAAGAAVMAAMVGLAVWARRNRHERSAGSGRWLADRPRRRGRRMPALRRRWSRGRRW
jgi:hypothetical protein